MHEYLGDLDTRKKQCIKIHVAVKVYKCNRENLAVELIIIIMG